MAKLLLTNARVLDGLGGVIERANVRVDGERVVEVSPDAGTSPDPGLETMDLSGRTLMPALVDAHVHLSSYQMLPPLLRGEEPRADAVHYFELANSARNLVRMGILTVRDVGSMDDHAAPQAGNPARPRSRTAYPHLRPNHLGYEPGLSHLHHDVPTRRRG